MKVTKQNYYMDGYLKSNLDIAKQVIKEDWDMIFLVDGNEGSGKSVLAMQAAYYCDPSLTLDRVCFTPKEFRQAILNSEKYQAVIYDEAYTGLSSRATMSLINRTLISMLAEIRQRNLFVFIVMPCFFDLDKYAALWRSRILLHVYTKNFERGRFSFYNQSKKKQLYMYGKRYYSYSKPKFNFNGRFTNHYVVDEKAYKKKKKESLTAREKKTEDAEKKRELQDEMFERVMQMEDVPHKQKIRLLGIPTSTYFIKLRKWRELQESN